MLPCRASKTQHCSRLALGLVLVVATRKLLLQIVCLRREHEYLVVHSSTVH